MTGDPVTPFLVENWSQGAAAPATSARPTRRCAERRSGTPPAGSPYNGRDGNPWYTKRGYIPSGEHLRRQGRRQRLPAPGVGDARVRRRGRRAVADGQGPRQGRRRGDARQARPELPQPVGRLDRALPPAHGRRRVDRSVRPGDGRRPVPRVRRLPVPVARPAGPGRADRPARRQRAARTNGSTTSSPTTSCSPTRRAPRAREWVNSAYDYYGAKTYNPNNEPDLLSPYTYLWTGQPYKTATVVRAAETLFTNGPDGHDGQRRPRHDVGLVRVLLARAVPDDERRELLRHLEPAVPGRDGAGRQLREVAGRRRSRSARPASSDDARYIQSASLDGSGFIAHLRDAGRHRARGEARLHASARSPRAGGRGAKDAPPSVDRAPFTTVDLSGRLTPAQAIAEPSPDKPTTTRLSLQLLATTPGNADVSVTATAPHGLHDPARDRADPDPLARPAHLGRRAVHGHRPGRHAGGQLPGVGARADGRGTGDHPQRDDPRALRQLREHVRRRLRRRPLARLQPRRRRDAGRTPRRATSTTAGGASRPT